MTTAEVVGKAIGYTIIAIVVPAFCFAAGLCVGLFILGFRLVTGL